jgi:phosphoglycolate phosphatase-like HAD superfamily hydrolase
MIKAIHIYDIDGTIVDSSHRYRYIERNGKRTIDLDFWREHDVECYIMQDKLLPLAEQYKNDLKDPEIFVVIATARAIEYGDANYKYVLYNLGLPNRFIYREGTKDRRGGADLKIQGLKPIVEKFSHAVVRFWEDNLDYLTTVCDTIGAEPNYVKSNQGY